MITQFVINSYNWYFLNANSVPLKSDLINWVAHYKLENPKDQHSWNSYVRTYSIDKARYSTQKTGLSTLDKVLDRSFGQLLFLHQLQHIYCELFDIPVELSNNDFVEYFFANTPSSIEREFNDRIHAKYNLPIEDCAEFAKRFTKHPVTSLPSYAECVKEVEVILANNFEFLPHKSE